MANPRTIIGSAHWATFLVNGDESGFSDHERNLCLAWLDRELLPHEIVVDCGEPFFTWHYGLHTGDTCSGGECVEYTVIG